MIQTSQPKGTDNTLLVSVYAAAALKASLGQAAERAIAALDGQTFDGAPMPALPALANVKIEADEEGAALSWSSPDGQYWCCLDVFNDGTSNFCASALNEGGEVYVDSQS
jgi:hypothetical protein